MERLSPDPGPVPVVSRLQKLRDLPEATHKPLLVLINRRTHPHQQEQEEEGAAARRLGIDVHGGKPGKEPPVKARMC